MKHLRRVFSCLLIFLTCFSFSTAFFSARTQALEVCDAPVLLENTNDGGFAFFVLMNDYTVVAELPVKLSRQSDTVAIVPARDLVCYLSTSVDVEKDVTFTYEWDVKELRAPVKLAQKVGTVRAYLGDTLLDEADLVTNYTVSKSLLSELFEYVKYIFLHPVTLLILAALIALWVIRLLRGARMATAIKAGKFVPDDEPDAPDQEKTEGLRSEGSQEERK